MGYLILVIFILYLFYIIFKQKLQKLDYLERWGKSLDTYKLYLDQITASVIYNQKLKTELSEKLKQVWLLIDQLNTNKDYNNAENYSKNFKEIEYLIKSLKFTEQDVKYLISKIGKLKKDEPKQITSGRD